MKKLLTDALRNVNFFNEKVVELGACPPQISILLVEKEFGGLGVQNIVCLLCPSLRGHGPVARPLDPPMGPGTHGAELHHRRHVQSL